LLSIHMECLSLLTGLAPPINNSWLLIMHGYKVERELKSSTSIKLTTLSHGKLLSEPNQQLLKVKIPIILAQNGK
jgi:hypothetical protein